MKLKVNTNPTVLPAKKVYASHWWRETNLWKKEVGRQAETCTFRLFCRLAAVMVTISVIAASEPAAQILKYIVWNQLSYCFLEWTRNSQKQSSSRWVDLSRENSITSALRWEGNVKWKGNWMGDWHFESPSYGECEIEGYYCPLVCWRPYSGGCRKDCWRLGVEVDFSFLHFYDRESCRICKYAR
jgi:hypothetical protein